MKPVYLMRIYFRSAQKATSATNQRVFSQKKINGTRRKLLPPTSGSFNNCNGRWLEYIFAVYAWNAVAEVNQSCPDTNPYIYVKLPNNTSADTPGQGDHTTISWTSILDKVHFDRIMRKKQDLLEGSESKLEASNPDAVILQLPKEVCPEDFSPYSKIENISVQTQSRIDHLFFNCMEKIRQLNQIVAFISVKASTRSDRRYQFIVEGNSTKGLYATAFSHESNLKVGKLIENKYFAFSLEPSKSADHDALDGLIMFASLFNEAVGSTRAIDALYNCEKPSEVAKIIKEICTQP